MVALADYAKNPVVMAGEGEVTFENVRLSLKPLAKPATLPDAFRSPM